MLIVSWINLKYILEPSVLLITAYKYENMFCPLKCGQLTSLFGYGFEVVKVMSSSIPKVLHVTKCTKNIRISTRVLPFLTSSNLSKT